MNYLEQLTLSLVSAMALSYSVGGNRKMLVVPSREAVRKKMRNSRSRTMAT